MGSFPRAKVSNDRESNHTYEISTTDQMACVTHNNFQGDKIIPHCNDLVRGRQE